MYAHALNSVDTDSPGIIMFIRILNFDGLVYLSGASCHSV